MKRLSLILVLAFALVSCRKDKDFDVEVWTVSDQMVMSGTLFGGQVECIQVKKPGSQNWEPVCRPIEGFTYERGYTYSISVRIYTVKDPPADGSSLRYVLEKVISKN